MLRINDRIWDVLYDGDPLPIKRKTREKWNPHVLISDEQYEINLKYLFFMYELNKPDRRPHDPIKRELLVEGVMELCECDPEIRDAKQLHQIQKIADTWD